MSASTDCESGAAHVCLGLVLGQARAQEGISLFHVLALSWCLVEIKLRLRKDFRNYRLKWKTVQHFRCLVTLRLRKDLGGHELSVEASGAFWVLALAWCLVTLRLRKDCSSWL